ncbi:MAG: hypothetical protein FRX49_06246 [Trebouxia sp. A1-2]|nr:MAG: hypothetical protein FRX49_06246 [Trebouxia sp. A1-2]
MPDMQAQMETVMCADLSRELSVLALNHHRTLRHNVNTRHLALLAYSKSMSKCMATRKLLVAADDTKSKKTSAVGSLQQQISPQDN